MVWLSIVSLAVGMLAAQRFKILVLMPAAFILVIMATIAGAGLTVLTIAAVTVGVQVGYLIGLIFQHNLSRGWESRPSSFSRATSAKDVR